MGQAAAQKPEQRNGEGRAAVRLPSPFALKILHTAGEGRRQGSSMNSPCSALTAALAGSPDPQIRAKGDYECGQPRVPQLAKSVYDVPGTKCILCPGLDRDSSRHPFATATQCPSGASA